MNVTVREQIFVAASPQRVWDYTQDWRRRTEWDAAVKAAEILAEEPRTVRVRAAGGVRSTVRYKLYDRPRRTSLAMTDFSSWLVTGGGGSWEYVSREGGTDFVQTNTIAIRGGLLGRVLAPIVRWRLRASTLRALGKAKAILESADRGSERSR